MELEQGRPKKQIEEFCTWSSVMSHNGQCSMVSIFIWLPLVIT